MTPLIACCCVDCCVTELEFNERVGDGCATPPDAEFLL